MSGHAGQLGELTGLDEETVKEQILPYLATFTTKQALVNHLQDLIGPGPAQKTFIQSFADERYPHAPTPRATTPSIASESSQTVASTALLKPANTGRKTKSKFPSKLPPPRKVDAASFGGVGSVYRKGQDEALSFGATSTGSISGKASPSIAHAPSLVRPDVRTPEIHGSNHQEPSSATSASKTSAPTTAKPGSEQEYTMISTDEMKNVQQFIALLRGDTKEDPAIKAKPCFCQGRRHELHPYVPLCLTCGLILCSILSPSPMLLPSPACPSCAAAILNSTSRAILLTQLDLTLASLTQTQQEKMQLIREEKQQAWKEKRKEVELFPELQQQMGNAVSSTSLMVSDISTGSRQGQQYNVFHERRRNIDIAMGRKVEEDSQRRSRVLRIESKPIKGKGGLIKKKKQPKTSIEGSQQVKAGTIIHKDKVLEGRSGEESDQAEEEEEEEEEEEIGLDYDYEEQGSGPFADADDDGFAQHSSTFPLDSIYNSDHNNHSWTKPNSFLPTISYVSEKDRTIDAVDEDEEGERGSRQVPGSAPKESKIKHSNSRHKGRDKGTVKTEG